MLKNLNRYHKPSTIGEALDILKNSEKVKILAGGTSVAVNKNDDINVLVDIKGLGLNYIKKENNEIKIGATTTVNEMLDSELIKQYCGGIVHKACYTVASTPLRNMITAGGNSTQVYRWSDLPLVFLTTGASFEIKSGDGLEKTITAGEFFKKHPQYALKKTDILTEIKLPYNKGYEGNFLKFSKTSFDYTLLNVSAFLNVDDMGRSGFKIGLGGASLLPRVFDVITGNTVVTEFVKTQNFDSVLEMISSDAVFNTDIRVTEGYKKTVFKNLAKRVVAEILQN